MRTSPYQTCSTSGSHGKGRHSVDSQAPRVRTVLLSVNLSTRSRLCCCCCALLLRATASPFGMVGKRLLSDLASSRPCRHSQLSWSHHVCLTLTRLSGAGLVLLSTPALAATRIVSTPSIVLQLRPPDSLPTHFPPGGAWAEPSSDLGVTRPPECFVGCHDTLHRDGWAW